MAGWRNSRILAGWVLDGGELGDEGHWVDDLKHGQGVYKYVVEDAVYTGEWKDGQQNGIGTFTFPNGSKDVGEWKANKLNGEAIQYFADGNIYSAIIILPRYDSIVLLIVLKKKMPFSLVNDMHFFINIW